MGDAVDVLLGCRRPRLGWPNWRVRATPCRGARGYELRSASGRPAARLVLKIPTAVHADVAVHDTPVGLLLIAPVGLGVGWMVQLMPFQPSASVTGGPTLLV